MTLKLFIVGDPSNDDLVGLKEVVILQGDREGVRSVAPFLYQDVCLVPAPLMAQIVIVLGAAQALSFDINEIRYCPVCDGDLAGDHSEDCTFSKFEAALDAYAKMVQQ